MMRNKSRQRGIAAIEFALIAPVVLVVLFGIFEFGFAFWRKQSLTAAVREGARKAVVKTTEVKNEAWVRGKVEAYMDGVGLTDTGRFIDCPACPCAASGQTITVRAWYPTHFLVLSALKYGGGMASSVSLDAQIVMQCE